MAEKKAIRPLLDSLGVGERVEFPASQYSSVAVTCTNFGFETGRKYSVAKNREKENITVTRIQ